MTLKQAGLGLGFIGLGLGAFIVSLALKSSSTGLGFFYTQDFFLAFGVLILSIHYRYLTEKGGSLLRTSPVQIIQNCAVVGSLIIACLVVAMAATHYQYQEVVASAHVQSYVPQHYGEYQNPWVSTGGWLDANLFGKEVGPAVLGLLFGIAAVGVSYLGYHSLTQAALVPEQSASVRRFAQSIVGMIALLAIVVSILVFAAGSNGHAYALRFGGYGAALFVSVLAFSLGILSRDEKSPRVSRIAFLLQIPVSFVVGFLYGAFLYVLVQIPAPNPDPTAPQITITGSGPVWWALLMMLASALLAFIVLDSESVFHGLVLGQPSLEPVQPDDD